MDAATRARLRREFQTLAARLGLIVPREFIGPLVGRSTDPQERKDARMKAKRKTKSKRPVPSLEGFDRKAWDLSNLGCESARHEAVTGSEPSASRPTGGLRAIGRHLSRNRYVDARRLDAHHYSVSLTHETSGLGFLLTISGDDRAALIDLLTRLPELT